MIEYRFATAEAPLLRLGRARVFFDGTFTEPRLQHPECVAIGPDGHVWCGSENGQILRIAPDGSAIEEVATTGGFTLGLAFDGDRALYACDQKYAAVFRLDLSTRKLERFTPPGIRIPNYPVVDARRGRLLVSDSHAAGTAGPGVWSYDLASGEGGLWYREPMVFANGMALAPEGDALFVCETFARKVTRIPIAPDGDAGEAAPYATDLPGLPDGIALDDAGVLFVGCYEPSRVLRIPPGGGRAEVYIEDPTAHLFAHPTNIAFDGSALYTANLGRWHVTRIDTDTSGTPLHARHGQRP
ncbi:MAG TPA: SMP-30/gluconolactonase/LRE family protein [Pararhizobium sp.]|nr:SMP-30/gluconolactonase/LRE family protein [Pararhizobium sp.]